MLTMMKRTLEVSWEEGFGEVCRRDGRCQLCKEKQKAFLVVVVVGKMKVRLKIIVDWIVRVVAVAAVVVE